MGGGVKMDEIAKIINNMSETEVKGVLFDIIRDNYKIGRSDYTKEDFYKDLDDNIRKVVGSAIHSKKASQ